MKINFSMPELLVVFSLFMYPQSYTFAAIAFCIGVFSRFMNYMIAYGLEQKKAEAMTQNIDELGNAFKGLFNGKESIREKQ